MYTPVPALLFSSVTSASQRGGQTGALLVLADVLGSPAETSLLRAIEPFTDGSSNPLCFEALLSKVRQTLLGKASHVYGEDVSCQLGWSF